MSNPVKYNTVQVIFHWLAAVLVIFMLVMGHFGLAATPNANPDKIFALRGHMIFGAAVLALTVLRMLWRRFTVQPAPVATGLALLDKAGMIAHYLLNLLVLLVAISGIGIAYQAGLSDIVFDGVGSLPEDFWAYPPRFVHGVLTKALAALIVLHVLGALYHQILLKDGLLKRMRFSSS